MEYLYIQYLKNCMICETFCFKTEFGFGMVRIEQFCDQHKFGEKIMGPKMRVVTKTI